MAGHPLDWHPDPTGRHELRYFAAGHPTALVRDGEVEGLDPYDDPPGRAAQTGESLATCNWAPALPDAQFVAPEQYEPPPGTAAGQLDPIYPAMDYPPPGLAPLDRGVQPPPVVTHRGLSRRIALGAGVLAVGAAIAVAISATNRSSTDNATVHLDVTPAVTDTATTGVVVTSAAGHFRARFPSQPTEQTIAATIAGIRLKGQLDYSQNPTTRVESESISQTVPPDDYQNSMKIGLNAFAAGAGLASPTQTATTFRGYPARGATYILPSGVHLSAITFFYTGRQRFVLVAQSGEPFNELVASFSVVR